MKRLVLAALASVMISVGVMAAPSVTTAGTVARGEFTVAVDVATAVLHPVGERACKVTVDATLTFTGTIVGVAEGTTVALVAAPCSDVATTPPGTFADVFAFVGDFAGTVADEAAQAKLGYAGATRAGGAIKALMTLSHGARALLKVDAVAGVGGTYSGFASA